MNIVKIYELFPTEKDCLAHLENVRWQGKPKCTYCQSTNATPMPKEERYHCNNCNTTFSVTVGTIIHHTHLPLQKWFLAISLVLNAKKGISARQLARDLQVNKDTAWRMGMKVRQAMTQQTQRALLTGIVEMDETYIGGKPRRGGNNGEPLKRGRGRGTKKTPVVGMIERNGSVRAKVMKKERLNGKNLKVLVRNHIDTAKATLITDEYTRDTEDCCTQSNQPYRLVCEWRYAHQQHGIILGIVETGDRRPVPQSQLALPSKVYR